jgi:hypothetical protein
VFERTAFPDIELSSDIFSDENNLFTRAQQSASGLGVSTITACHRGARPGLRVENAAAHDRSDEGEKETRIVIVTSTFALHGRWLHACQSPLDSAP